MSSIDSRDLDRDTTTPESARVTEVGEAEINCNCAKATASASAESAPKALAMPTAGTVTALAIRPTPIAAARRGVAP
jgi:hypothetical protein